MIKMIFGLMLMLVLSTPSEAALVVATCGTVSQTYPVGSVRQITVDTTGKVCT